MNDRFLRELRGEAIKAKITRTSDLGLAAQADHTFIEHDRFKARLNIGAFFVSELHFEEKNAS